MNQCLSLILAPLGQLDFYHQQMREAVARQYLAEQALRQQAHAALSDYLETLPTTDPVIQMERMRQLLGERNRCRAANYYADLTAPDYEAGEGRGGPDWELVDWIVAGELARRRGRGA